MIKGKIIKWARERAKFSLQSAATKLNVSETTLQHWEKDTVQPTTRQIENIAKKYYIPFGYLFLNEPLDETLDIPDYRTIKNKELQTPSLELLDSVYDAQRKQAWLKEIREEEQQPPIINTNNPQDNAQIISAIRDLLNIDQMQSEAKNYESYLSNIIAELDNQGIMVIKNGVVGFNTHRPLDWKEFRGFALYDDYAPLIFINGNDYKSAQIFTIIHELAHILLKESSLDGNYNKNTEQKCNIIAAEILAPTKIMKEWYEEKQELKIAHQLKVSSFVILIKAKQLRLINQDYFDERWKYFKEHYDKLQISSSGGSFYANLPYKAGGRQFLDAVINYTLSGKLLCRDAYNLTGLNSKTFNTYFNEGRIYS